LHPFPFFYEERTRGSGRIVRGLLRETEKRSFLGASDQASQKGHQEQNQKNEEEQLGDAGSGYSNTSETKNCSDNRDHEKGKRPPKHLRSSVEIA
jgi:hypothetical protein